MIPIELTWAELWLAINAGVLRRLNGVRNKRAEPYGARPTAAWNDDINGCIAELALAKYLDIFWSGTVGRLDLPDVGTLQVRSKTQSDHRLVVLKSDDDAKPFVSVLVGLPICHLCGWMFARDAKQPPWLLPDPLKPDRFFVPNTALQPIEALKARALSQEASAAPLAPSRGEAPFESPRLSTHSASDRCGEPSAQGHEP